MKTVHYDINEKQHNPLLVPTQENWDQMSPSQQDEIEESIICALEYEFNMMGETTVHFNARASATEVLKRYYRGQGRDVFIASDLHTLYPDTNAFYPDLLLVFDVQDHHRRSWNVLREKKGLDFVLEIISRSSRRNDQVEKLNLFAKLGIPEYFMFDPDQHAIMGYQLDLHEGFQQYHQILPSSPNKVFSTMLGLALMIEDYKLRFVSSDGLEILFGDELITRLNNKLTGKDDIIADSLRQIEEQRKQKKKEKARADRLEEQLKNLRLQLKSTGNKTPFDDDEN